MAVRADVQADGRRAALRLATSVGQASRFPTMGELYQLATIGTTPVLSNSTLKPESVLSEEITIAQRFVDGKVRLSVFNENVHDALIAKLTALNDGTGT
jgi:iron complex outermembrane recepter protein